MAVVEQHSTRFFPAECQKGAPCPKLPSTRNSQDIAHHSEVPDLRAGLTGPPPASGRVAQRAHRPPERDALPGVNSPTLADM